MNNKKDIDSQIVPFLKWPGGKRWLAPVIADAIRHELNGTYIEPFLGAGAVLLELNPKQSIASDINSDLIRCLEVVRAHPHKVLNYLRRLSNTRECYYRVRSLKPRTAVSAAARLIYLTRTAWGGMYRTNQKGEFNVPFGGSGRKIVLSESLFNCAARYKNVSLRTNDFEITIDRARMGDVVYADPPYTTKGQYNGFLRYNEKLFSWEDQTRLAKTSKRASRRGAYVIVSGLWHKHILGLYPNWWALKVDRSSRIARNVQSRHTVSEAVLFSKKPNNIPDKHLGKLTRLDKNIDIVQLDRDLT